MKNRIDDKKPVPNEVVREQIAIPIVEGIVKDVSGFGKGKFREGFEDLISGVNSPLEDEGTASQLRKWGYRSAESTRSVDEDILPVASPNETDENWKIVKQNYYAESETVITETSTYNDRSFPMMNAKFSRARLEDESPAQKEHRRNIDAMKKIVAGKTNEPDSESAQVVASFIDIVLENAYLRFKLHEIRKQFALEKDDETDSSENAEQEEEGVEESNEVADDDHEEANNGSYDEEEEEVDDQLEEEASEEESNADEEVVSEMGSEEIDDEEDEEETSIPDAHLEAEHANEYENTPFEMVSRILSSIVDAIPDENHDEVGEAQVVVGLGK